MRSAWLTVPNLLSLARIAAVPVILALLVVPGTQAQLAAAALFALASITDYLDGYLARRTRQVTVLGAFLDLTADKLLVAGVLIWLVGDGRVDAWIAVVIVLRELLVSGVRTFAAARGTAIPAGMAGKTKTTITLIAIVGAILGQVWAFPLLLVAVALTIVSAVPYVTSGLSSALREA